VLCLEEDWHLEYVGYECEEGLIS